MTENYPVSSSPIDNYLSVLSNEYRRHVLVELRYHDPQRDGAIQIPADIVPPNQNSQSLEIQMVHNHLPKLEQAGFIEWNRERNTVRRGPQFAEIRPLVALLCEHADELPDGRL
jgi:hypothetical protein